MRDVLVEEYGYDDWGYATFPLHPDLETIDDLLRVGAQGLCIRFREIDPLAWTTLIDKLQELR